VTASLLDVNVLLALFDPSHVFHPPATRWFRDHAGDGWATCPLTQNGFVRIASHRSYPQPRSVDEAIRVLRTATSSRNHVFWPDDVTLTDPSRLDPAHLLSSGQVTDAYLLALAVQAGGQLVTFDTRIDISAAPGASRSSLCILEARQP